MMRFYSGIDMKGNRIVNSPDLANVIFQQDYTYHVGDLFIYGNKLYLVDQDFTSSNLGPTIDDDFAADLSAAKFKETSIGSGASIQEYTQNTAYTKDTLVYLGDRLGRVVADFTSDSSKILIQDSFAKDIAAGSIVVDKIAIDELDDQLLKALPIVAFVTKKDIPRFESGMTIPGTTPTFRDGTSLSDEEKKGANFFYIIDNNGELTGLAIITNYDELTDSFTVNAMKYGVGTQDNILPADHVLTKRSVGETETVNKDDLLNPVLIIKSSPPADNTKLWYQSTKLDASDITIGTVNIKRYNSSTSAWDINDTVDVKDSEVVKNGNGTEWQYYRIQSRGHVLISLADWQLVYDTAQILGKIIDVDTTTHQVTVKIIHANNLGEPELTEDIQANVAIGAAPANFLYPEGMTFTEFVKKIALKDMPVTITFTATGSGLHKEGTTVNGSTLTATITNLGNVGIQNLVFYQGNTVVSTQPYVDGTLTYTFTHTDPITANTTFKVVVNQEKGYSVTKTAAINFVNPSYFGTASTLTPSVSDVVALTEIIKDKKSGTYTHSLSDERACYAYPVSLGNLTSIKDNNNFEYLASFTKSTMTINSETYNVYVLTDPVTASNFTWKFE